MKKLLATVAKHLPYVDVVLGSIKAITDALTGIKKVADEAQDMAQKRRESKTPVQTRFYLEQTPNNKGEMSGEMRIVAPGSNESPVTIQDIYVTPSVVSASGKPFTPKAGRQMGFGGKKTMSLKLRDSSPAGKGRPIHGQLNPPITLKPGESIALDCRLNMRSWLSRIEPPTHGLQLSREEVPGEQVFIQALKAYHMDPHVKFKVFVGGNGKDGFFEFTTGKDGVADSEIRVRGRSKTTSGPSFRMLNAIGRFINRHYPYVGDQLSDAPVNDKTKELVDLPEHLEMMSAARQRMSEFYSDRYAVMKDVETAADAQMAWIAPLHHALCDWGGN